MWSAARASRRVSAAWMDSQMAHSRPSSAGRSPAMNRSASANSARMPIGAPFSYSPFVSVGGYKSKAMPWARGSEAPQLMVVVCRRM